MRGVLICAVIAAGIMPASGDEILVPIVDGPWWQVAGNPDLGELTGPEQQPVDFAVWQAADGTWQLWSCIRHTKCGGHTRLFYRWEGANITDSDWTPKGIAMMSDAALGEPLGGLQAPHVVTWQDRYWMAYGDWDNICFATSPDGKTFERVVQQSTGRTGQFTEGLSVNTRDAVLLYTNGLWHCYYTAFPNGRGYNYCRTSPDLVTWSPSCVVAYGGWAGNHPFSAECPHVVEPEPHVHYLFRTQRYGENAQTSVYRSQNPLNFGIDDDHYFVRAMPIAAPEIVLHEGQYYIATLLPNLQGIRIAKLDWVRAEEGGAPVFDLADAAERGRWRVLEGSLDPLFTESNSRNQDYAAPMGFYIGTAQNGTNPMDESRTCAIESPAFTVEDTVYTIYMSGGGEIERLHILLVDSASGEELMRLSGRYTGRFERRSFSGTPYAGRRACLRIVDAHPGPWGYLNFGGLYTHRFEDRP